MPVSERVTGLMRPLPFRGDLIAAGSVPLAVGVILIDARMDGSWDAGIRFAIAAAAAVLLLALAWRAPAETESPRMYVSVLLATAFPLLVVALIELADALGGSLDASGTSTWMLALLAATYAFFARARNSPISTLLASVAAAGALVSLWSWVFDPHGLTPYRWLLLLAIVVLGLGVVRLRDTRHEHAVALVDAAGIAALALGALLYAGFVTDSIGAVFGSDGGQTLSHAGWGWKVVLLAVGFGLVAFAAVERERGPGWLGALVLVEFVFIVTDHRSLLWWPLLLVLLGAGVIAAGLRPTTPAPPSPDASAPAPPAPRPFAPPAAPEPEPEPPA
jgi:hypothetical protein